MSWLFPLRHLDYSDNIPIQPHPGSFGFVRKFHIHEGVDLYVPEGTDVYAVEAGKIVFIGHFTGPSASSPWWNDTKCVMVEGETGVVCYGEIEPSQYIEIDKVILRGEFVGRVKQVLKKDKGRPMSMLHLELYTSGTKEPVEWKVGEEQPSNLLDPTDYLKEIK